MLRNISQTILGSIFFVSIVAAPMAIVSAQEIDKQTLQEAQRTVEITGVLSQFENMIPAISERIKQSFTSTDPLFLTDKQLQENLDISMDLAKAEAEKLRPKLDQDIIQLYAKRFTYDELRDINNFLSSDVGKKFTSEAPKLITDSVRLSQYWAGEMTQAIEKRAREELIKRGYNFN